MQTQVDNLPNKHGGSSISGFGFLPFVDFSTMKSLFSKPKVGLMKVADLTVEELQALIKNTLHEELQELFADPDAERELTQEMEARLASSLQSTERVPFEEVKRRYTLR